MSKNQDEIKQELLDFRNQNKKEKKIRDKKITLQNTQERVDLNKY